MMAASQGRLSPVTTACAMGALAWYITGNASYAQKAIQIMDAWSATITSHTNSNAPLQTWI